MDSYELRVQRDIFLKYLNKIHSFKDDFINRFYSIYDNCGYTEDTDNTKDTIKELISILVFGDYSDNTITKKVDYNKNKQTLKILMMDFIDFNRPVRLLKGMANFVSNFFEDLSDKFYKDSDKIIRDDKCPVQLFHELTRISTMIRSYDEAAFETCKNLYTLESIISTIKQGGNFDEMPKYFKKDTLKRYYFNHVYELKNSIKIFDKDRMIFGEINNIMRLYDNVFNFLFGEFVGFYSTLESIFSSK